MKLHRHSGTYKTSWRRRELCEDAPEVLGERFVGISTVPIPSTERCLGGLMMGEASRYEAKGVKVLNQPRSFATLVVQS
jgi:hypothetical protein